MMDDMIDKLKNKLAGPLYKIEFPHTVTLTANEANALNAELHAQRSRIEALERENARLREALVDAQEFAHGLSFSKSKIIADWAIRVENKCREVTA